VEEVRQTTQLELVASSGTVSLAAKKTCQVAARDGIAMRDGFPAAT
jgi:hypothetical protein